MKPKFRVWNEKTESFIDYGDLMLDLKNGKVYSGDVGIPEYTIDVTNQVILMQSTGLKDKNGVEIYKGDIVRVTDDDESTDFSDGGIGTICGLDELYMWYIDGQVQNGLFDISRQYYIEVIGNVHENPELMEV